MIYKHVLIPVALLIVQSAAAQSPSARACHASTYFAPAGGIVVIGGARACGVDVFADTVVWVWDGKWRTAGRFEPGAREDALIAYDTRREKLVLYGGRNGPQVFTDTWEWDGRTWAKLNPAQTPGRLEHAAIAFDSARGRTVVFGGGSRTGEVNNRTWEWDGANWALRAETGPPKRVGHSLAWSRQQRAVLLYGGFEAAQFRDLWKWDGSTWQQISAEGPTLSEGPALVATDSAMLLIGPGRGEHDEALKVWRVVGARVDMVHTQGPRNNAIGPAVAYDPKRKRVFWFGGGQLWEFDGSRWAQSAQR